MDQKTNLLSTLSVLWIWRRFIVINTLAVIILTVIISLLLPNWYKATTILLPPKQPDIFGNLGATGSLLKGLGSLGKLSGIGQKSGAYNYFAILKSRSTMERVINKFDLITVYDTKDRSMELAIKELETNTNFEEEIDDNISVQVYDKDRVRSAEMANYFVEVLNDVNTRLGTQEARTNREFIEQRLNRCRSDLRHAEDTMKAYQEKTGVMISADENSASVAAYAELYAMKVKKEIEISVLQQTVRADDSYLKQIEMEVSELNRRLNAFPSAGLESFRLYREVITQQRILEFILPIYEQARIDEQKNIPVLLVLDKAVPAEKKSRPQRLLIVFLVTFVSFLALILKTILLDRFVRSSEHVNQLEDKFHSYAQWIAHRYKIQTD